ncbi:MAG: hypothetical protein ABI681_06675 [Gemmatimonadales bacterium]
MIPKLRLVAIIAAISASAISAQTPSPVPVPDTTIGDPSTRNVVTYSVRSGKLALSSAADPGPAYMPDGTYTNDANMIIVIVDGRITRIQGSSGEITEISSVRLGRQRAIALTPATNALMAVSDITLPSGTFKSDDGRASFRVVAGRPTAFTLPDSAKEHH